MYIWLLIVFWLFHKNKIFIFSAISKLQVLLHLAEELHLLIQGLPLVVQVMDMERAEDITTGVVVVEED